MKDKNIKAKIVADSISKQGDRITTMVVTCPRIVLAEFNTHRMFSRNSASSRAIPFKKMVKRVMENPFIPMAFQKDHKGMQGTEYFTDDMEGFAFSDRGGKQTYLENPLQEVKEQWLFARDLAVKQAQNLNNIGVTKQLCNRLLEPFLYHTIIVTATEWENFFALRANKQAEIHIQDLAYKMLDAYNQNTPDLLQAGEWHIPFGDSIDEQRIKALYSKASSPLTWEEFLTRTRLQIATARCARVSYLNYEGTDDYTKDIRLYNRLMESGHWSPFEHCALAMSQEDYSQNLRFGESNFDIGLMPEVYGDVFGWSGNFKGFIQQRKVFASENKHDERVEHKRII